MTQARLIARLDIKGENLIKGVQLEGLRVMGDPKKFACDYYEQGIDEIIYMDVVASLYGRNNLVDIVKNTVKDIFIPVTVGGGIRSVEDVKEILRWGADKIAINTAAVKDPKLIKDISRKFGSQCVVLSIEAKRLGEGKWEVYTDNGREKTGLDVIEWAKKGVDLGAGEILITSVDREGTRKGFDVALVRAISSEVCVPVIASGGMGTSAHVIDVIKQGQADAVAMADALHYARVSISDIRNEARAFDIGVRTC